MRKTILVLIFLMFAASHQCAHAATRGSLRIYYYNWDAFPNARITADSIRENADAKISSASSAYITEFSEWIGKFRMSRCDGVKAADPPSLHLLIELERNGKLQIWVSDKTRLYSSDYRECAEIGDEFRDKFRWLDPWYAKVP